MNTFLQSFSSFIESAFSTVLLLSLIGSAVVIVAFLLQGFLRRKIPSKLMYLVWLLVVFRFVMIVAPASPTSFMNLFVSDSHIARPASISNGESLTIVASTHALSNSPILDSEWELDTHQESSSPVNVEAMIWQVLPWVWLGGVLAYVFLLLAQAVVIARTVRMSSLAVDEKIAKGFAAAKRSVGLPPNRTVHLRATCGIDVPAQVGLFRPTVLIPQWCLHELSEPQLNLIFIHELVHVKRRDGWVQLVAHFVGILHWFNPLVRLANSQVATYRELSCDQEVLRSIDRDSHDSESRLRAAQLYCRTILDISTFCRKDKTPGHGLVQGFLGRRNNLVFERIQMLDHQEKRSQSWVVFGVACVLSVLAIGYTGAQETDGGNSAKPVPTAEGMTEIGDGIQSEPVATLPRRSKTISLGQVLPQPIGPYVKQASYWTDLDNENLVAYRVEVFEGKPGEAKKLLSRAFGELDDYYIGVHSIGEKDSQRQTRLRKMLEVSDFKLVDQPVLVASLGKSAEFLKGSEVMAEKLEKNAAGEWVKKIEFVPVGFKLQFTPIVRKGRLITDVTAEYSQFITGQPKISIQIKEGFRLNRPNLHWTETQTTNVTNREDSFLLVSPMSHDKTGKHVHDFGLIIVTPKLVTPKQIPKEKKEPGMKEKKRAGAEFRK